MHNDSERAGVGIMNKIGPRTNPCGTLVSTATSVDFIPFTATKNLVSGIRVKPRQHMSWPHRSASLFKRVVWYNNPKKQERYFAVSIFFLITEILILKNIKQLNYKKISRKKGEFLVNKNFTHRYFKITFINMIIRQREPGF